MSVALAMAVVAHAAVIDLKAANAEEEMQEGQWFIKFYAPWCVEAAALQPSVRFAKECSCSPLRPAYAR